MARSKSGYWSAFTAGAAFGALAMTGLLSWKRNTGGSGRVIHIERSLNIGRPVEALFSAWLNVESMPQLIGSLRRVERFGADSRWLANIDGRDFEWDAQITQLIFNESIGWKSVTGPKHSGRISFSPLGDQTVVHVMMSYAPRVERVAAGTGIGIGTSLEHWIDRGLREFKASMEDDSLRREPLARTGTTGAEVESSWNTSTGPVGTPGKQAAPGRLATRDHQRTSSSVFAIACAPPSFGMVHRCKRCDWAGSSTEAKQSPTCDVCQALAHPGAGREV